MANNNDPEYLRRNDRGVEVRDLIAHLQTLDPTARLVYTVDGYDETPVDAKDFVRQASGSVEVKLPKELIKLIADSFKDEIDDLEDEVEQLEFTVKQKEEKLNNLESALDTIRRAASEALEN